MSTSDWPAGVGRIVLDTVDSTLSEATRRSPDLAAPTWILALKQTAGRARRGRDWVDPVGNFAATLVMWVDGGPQQAALRSFIASLALYDAIQLVTTKDSARHGGGAKAPALGAGRALSGPAARTGRGSYSLALKWPNDVLLNGGKVAGILLESSGQGALSIGIGVNLLNVPGAIEAGAVTPVSLLSETGARITPEEFLNALAPAFARYEAQFTTYGFAPIRTAWLDRAARLGEVITARTGNSEHIGTFETVDDSGALILSTSQGQQVIPAGEVYF